MRYTQGFVYNKAQSRIEANEETFISAGKNRPDKYVYYQTFEGHDIVEYNSIIVNIGPGISERRAQIVEGLYGISPTEIRTKGDKKDLVFRFARPISKASVMKLQSVMEKLYSAPTSFFTYYNYDSLEELGSYPDTSKILLVGNWLENKNTNSIKDVRNYDVFSQVELLDPVEVVGQMRGSELVDSGLGIIIGYGGNFDYVLSKLKSKDATYRFFNEFFNVGFNDAPDSVTSYMESGVPVAGQGIVIDGYKMYVFNEKSEMKELADFIISVHYKILRGNSISYIVSLSKGEEEVKHIEWPTSFSEVKIAEFVSSFGSYHITSTKNNIKKIHELISDTRVPQISVFHTYGKIEYENNQYMVFKDSAYNLTTKKLTPRFEGTPFYFVDDINGIMLEGSGGKSIEKNLGDECPSMGNTIINSYPTIAAVSQSVWSGISGDLIPMTACTWLGHAMFNPPESCPVFFTTGVTGTGKTTYARFLSTMFGIDKPLSIEGTTPFPLRISLTLMNRLPLFLNEFRTRMPGGYEKTQIIKSLFDGTAFKRGLKDLSVESHRFSAFLFMEGEELPESGATRSRAIIHKTTKAERRSNISPEKILVANKDTLESMCYSYFQTASRAEYMDAFDEAQELFARPGIEPRIWKNVSLMYAGAVAFYPEGKARFREVCDQLILLQMEDFERNGTTSEILGIIGKYVGHRFAKVFTSGNHVILGWNDIVEFAERQRITTELKMESYRDHIQGFGIELGYFVVKTTDPSGLYEEEKMIDGIRFHIDTAPKAFLSNPITYKLYTQYVQEKAKAA